MSGLPAEFETNSVEGKFLNKLRGAVSLSNSFLCVGLDPDLRRLPEAVHGDVRVFLREIISATSDLVCAYKPNIAFYEALGEEGWKVLRDTIRSIPDHIPVILDAKRADIGNTARMYAEAYFEDLGVDAVTVNPYMGYDAVEPFLAYGAVFVLCATTNPSAGELQLLIVEGRPLYLRVAEMATKWAEGGEVGLVVGAKDPEAVREVRKVASDLPFLVPGVGAQGGDLEASVRAGKDGGGVVVNVSRAVLYTSSGQDFAGAAREAAVSFVERMRKCVI